MDEKYCESCAMPMGSTDEMYGTNADGSKNDMFCKYCFDKGAYTFNGTMEEMIEICVPHMLADHAEMNADEARSMMKAYFPKLKRWQIAK